MLRMWTAALACAAVLAQGPSQREQMKRRMAERPDEPWPPMKGHVVVAWPGSAMGWKGYHEPGAWFSPAPGTFGVTVLPQRESAQALSGWGVETVNEAWRARWRAAGAGIYELEVEPRASGVHVRVQSAGPAGGPLRRLEQTAGGLRVNGDWLLSGGGKAATGGEGDWLWAEIAVTRKARFVLKKPGGTGLPWGTLAAVRCNDDRFSRSLEAQQRHLLMGLTGAETRPGETVNYPLKWLRDGSYTLTALAKAGHLETARILAQAFAEEDFFGGFGAEADAPGLALWALEEVAARLNDRQFDAWLWPHAQRKAEWIVKMRHATAPVRVAPRGPIVPRHRRDPNLDLVCDAARDGLIQGRMDHHRPLLFVNAVSYAGLRAAARLAQKMGRSGAAAAWEKEARETQEAWWRAFEIPKERGNERTGIVGLWPTGIAEDQPERYRAGLTEPDFSKTPLWTYFDLARAHNWLALGEADRMWRTLNYFWSHQPSPGLFTIWEGNGEENSFGLWENIRGWAAPPHVTPHYWAAAEMLHVQLDALAMERGGELVIGAGVPQEWLRGDIEASGIRTRRGTVDWTWKQGRLTVKVDGRRAAYRAGPAFR